MIAGSTMYHVMGRQAKGSHESTWIFYRDDLFVNSTEFTNFTC
jgi:hypothetical protein